MGALGGGDGGGGDGDGGGKFVGAAAGSTKVVFAPACAHVVGVYDVSTSSFDSSASTGAEFAGAAALGTKVVFVPHDADNIGVYDVSTGTFSSSIASQPQGEYTQNRVWVWHARLALTWPWL